MSVADDAKGLGTVESTHSVDETIRRLQAMLETKGAKVFAIVDHSGEAARVGLAMPNTKLVIFGSPVGGTPLMLAAPTIAIDLPLKLLIREVEDSGKAAPRVLVSYNRAEFLMERHGVPAELAAVLKGVEALTHALTMDELSAPS